MVMVMDRGCEFAYLCAAGGWNDTKPQCKYTPTLVGIKVEEGSKMINQDYMH